VDPKEPEFQNSTLPSSLKLFSAFKTQNIFSAALSNQNNIAKWHEKAYEILIKN
jgi:hypothetical protein